MGLQSTASQTKISITNQKVTHKSKWNGRHHSGNAMLRLLQTKKIRSMTKPVAPQGLEGSVQIASHLLMSAVGVRYAGRAGGCPGFLGGVIPHASIPYVRNAIRKVF